MKELKEIGEENTITLVEWVYDFLILKFGLTKIAERKFISLLSSCLFYKDQSSRVRIFGRLLGLYDNLNL